MDGVLFPGIIVGELSGGRKLLKFLKSKFAVYICNACLSADILGTNTKVITDWT